MNQPVLTISQLTDSIRNCLNGQYADVWISGEISELSRPQSGHIYLTLKDDFSQLSAIIWRSTAEQLSFQPDSGVQVLCRGYIDVYPARGSYQLIIQQLQPLGEGALQIAFRKLHQKLKGEGLFDSRYKQKLPEIPRRILVVTSPSGAAIHDFVSVLQRRWPDVQVLICPVKVQGPDASAAIASAIRRCSKTFEFNPDVMVVTRGGGSLEDLWAFNEEPVVRAMFDCPIPTVSAVGHEIDVTLSDLVADVRALTPSEAAEILVPDQADVLSQLQALDTKLDKTILQRVSELRDAVANLADRPVLRQPEKIVQHFSQQLDFLDIKLRQLSQRRFEVARQQLLLNYQRLKTSSVNLIPNARKTLDDAARSMKYSMSTQIQALQRQVQVAEGKLKAFNPSHVLNRGYSLTVDEKGQPLTNCQNVKTGDKIQTWLGHGKLSSTVEQVESDVSYHANNDIEHGQEKDS